MKALRFDALRGGLAAAWPGILVAVAGGLLWGLNFGREPLPLLPWVSLAPLILLLGTRRPGWFGFFHGFAAWAVSLSWIAPTLVTFGGIPRPMSAVLTSLLVTYLALYHAAFAFLGARIWRRRGWLRLLALPALWVALEWLRTHLFRGFPWNLAAYSWVDVPGALPLSAWSGAYGISFLAVMTSTALVMSAGKPAPGKRRRWEPLAVGFAVPLLLLPLAGRWSLQLEVAEQGRALSGAGGEVRLLQPNIPNLAEYEPVAVMRNYRKVIEYSNRACEPGTLVVWPESAAWPFNYASDAILIQDLQSMVDRGCTVIFNSSHPEGEMFYNSAFLLAPGQEPARYDKRHLVPFGEYVPFRGVFSFVDKLARSAGEFLPSDRVALLPWKNERLGMAICYEVVYPGEVAELTRAGATMLVTITNDAWYGDTAAPWQHFRAARFRA
ncbi:MAG TPA: apolipoprotein N-acyltransferase, partial [Thermoanaerobaculia bacterium]|nr:apolipoprotein N-acyltransferase [Thermoanaerobaculia bacterium]